MSKRKYKAGRQIISISDFDKCEATFYIWNGRTRHRSVEAGYRLPFHTYAEWARMGYQVQKGSKAVIKTMLWKPVKNNVTAKTTEGEEKEITGTKMIMVKAALFSNEQVAKIEAA